MPTIGLIVFPAFSPMNLGVTSVFETANWKLGSAAYEVTLLSEHGGPVATSLGSQIQTSSFKRRRFDTLLMAGGIAIPTATPGLLNYLRSAVHRCRRIASICTGALILAEAGLLDGRRATTHWQFARAMQLRYPKIAVEEDRIFHRRAGGQSQFSTLLDLDAASDRVQTALTYAREHLSKPLSVRDLAKAAFLSPRQFSRLFKQETGRSPAKAIERLRLESARLMMEAGRFSAEEIARKNGFGNRERMRRSFVRALGQSPQALQRTVSALIQ